MNMLSSLLADYHAWLQIADTSIPRNIFGYLLQLCLTPLRTDPFITTPYDSPTEIAKCGRDIGKRSFLPDALPEREGPRPKICKYIAPNRQISQRTGGEMHKVEPTSYNVRRPQLISMR
jgi:hypothetical protein